MDLSFDPTPVLDDAAREAFSGQWSDRKWLKLEERRTPTRADRLPRL
ncbi:hypothetical protein [Streptomyces sp. cmx-18-6]